MKKVLKAAGLFILSLCFALSGFFILPIKDTTAGIQYFSPTLTANITSPSNGATIQVGDCFDVTATITITCPVQLTRSNVKDSSFIQPVYAIFDSCDVQNVTATIEIAGNAALQESATKEAGTDLSCPDGIGSGCPSTATVTWRVCCTGPGQVTITVTPYGESVYGVSQAPGIFVQPVSARDIVGYSPIPSENLISDTISITQIAKDDFYDKWLMDSGVSWARPHSIRTINAWAQPQTLQAGQKVTIYANMANRGDIEGPYTAALKINGVEEAVKTGMLQGNTAVPVEFIVSRDEPGTYQVEINGQKTFFTVIGDGGKQSPSSKNTQNLLLIWGFILLALIIALAIIILRRRQSYN